MTRVILTGLTLALLSASPATAQDRWGFELRANGAVPTQDIGADRLQTGLGFEATVSYRFLPHLAAYAGWDWIHFGSNDTFLGTDTDFEETGYVLGLRFEHPLAWAPGVAGWLRAGATYDHIEVEDDEGHLLADSGHGLGWEAGAGLALPVGERWSVTPGIRYRALSQELEVDAIATPVAMEYVAFELGIARRF